MCASEIANGQGEYIWASRNRYSLLEGQLFMPDEWFDEAYCEKRKACGVPEGLIYKTKPEIGLELLQKAVKRGHLPFQWVAADELYGRRALFEMARAMGKWYFTEVKSTTLIWGVRPEVHF